MKEVAVGIIVNDEKVLLCQRKRTARYPLKWEFPGGKVEDGESPEECLRRELNEELGIHAEHGDLYHRQHYTYADSGAFDVLYYKVTRHRGEIVNHVFESYEWVPVLELRTYDILEGNRDVVDRLIVEYDSVGSREG
ncbi:MAG TPA: (deoxy)nucleoside triphosphate pyrophosphohydrolase [Bacteroidota bacterium]|jgi:8-oxo-dGTP diphosphatase|nr:(deoxy)nucleoside triphosphate pyrophosphohydrolase [Bacteroidota bacterium]